MIFDANATRVYTHTHTNAAVHLYLTMTKHVSRDEKKETHTHDSKQWHFVIANSLGNNKFTHDIHMVVVVVFIPTHTRSYAMHRGGKSREQMKMCLVGCCCCCCRRVKSEFNRRHSLLLGIQILPTDKIKMTEWRRRQAKRKMNDTGEKYFHINRELYALRWLETERGRERKM